VKKLAKGEPVSGRKGERANIVDFKEPIEEPPPRTACPVAEAQVLESVPKRAETQRGNS
jgi:hypothetical protein